MDYVRRRLLLTVSAFVLGGAACRAASQAAPAAQPLTYVAIGASDSVGIGANSPTQESWPAVLHRKLPEGSRLVNLGVSGSLIHQAVEQQLPVAIDADPDLVTVWLAVNDYGARVPLSRYAADLDLLLSTLKEKSRAAILVGNIPDLGVLPVAARFDLQGIDRWNAAITELCRRHSATVVDLGPVWSEVTEHPEYISSDGFHPSTVGYQRLADLFYASVSVALKLPA